MARYIDVEPIISESEKELKILEQKMLRGVSGAGAAAGTLTGIIARLADTPTADVEASPKWIDVKERMPDTDDRYIVCTKNVTGWKPLKHNIFISEYMFNDFIYMGWENNPVTHWMFLPEPPNGAKMDGRK